jgi:hypothetical protein
MTETMTGSVTLGILAEDWERSLTAKTVAQDLKRGSALDAP